MAINKAGGPDPTQIQRMLAHARETGSQSAATRTGVVAKKAGDQTKTEGPKLKTEQSLLSPAARRAMEEEGLEQAIAKGQENVKDEAAVNQGKRRLHGKDEDEKKIDAGPIKQKDGTRVFPLDNDGEEAYEVTESQALAVDTLDRKTPEQILQGMPEGARKAAEATLDTQIKTKGTQNVAQLKDDPKVTAVAEQMDLDPAESLRESAKVAPIRDAKNEPPLMVEDAQSEALAKEAARRQLESGGADEAMIA